MRWEEKALYKAFLESGVRVELVNPGRSPLQLTEPPSGYSVALVRAMSRLVALAAAGFFEAWGVETVNSYRALAITGDKALSLAFLAVNGLPVPRSYLALGLESTLAASNDLGYPVVVKPCCGGWGLNSFKSPDPDTLAQMVELKEFSRCPPSRLHVVQEFIGPGGRDYRVFVIGGETVASMERIARSDWRANAARGASVRPAKLPPEAEDLAIKASEALGAEIAGVDLIRGENGFKVLEVNGVPEFKALRHATGTPIEKLIVSYLIGRAKR